MRTVTEVWLSALGIAEPVLTRHTLALVDQHALVRTTGAVTKPDTIDYTSGEPIPDGLFCYEIFGENAYASFVGPDDVTPSLRARQHGHIALALPIVHPLISPADLVEHVGISPAQARAALSPSDTDDLAVQREVTALAAAAPFVLHAVAVTPPLLRPITPMRDGRWAITDANDLYRRVIQRSTRLAKLLSLNAPPIILTNETRMLARGVRELFANTEVADATGRLLVPLLDDDLRRLLPTLADPPTTRTHQRAAAALTALGLELQPLPAALGVPL